MFVEVIVDIKSSTVDKTFYYKVPEKYQNMPLLGYRVEVPFGSRTIQGYIVKQLEENSNIAFDKDKCKYLKNIRDNHVVLTNELILLSKILSDELYCTQIQVIEAMIPTILKNQYIEYYKLEEDKSTLFDYKKYFGPNGLVEKKKLENKISEEELGYLLTQKIIKLISIAKDAVKINFENYLVLKNYKDQKLTKKQQQLVDYLKDYKVILKKDVKSILDIGDSVVKKLLQLNIIAEKLEEVDLKISKDILDNNNILNNQQKNVFDTILLGMEKKEFSEYLIHGVTGSGKTEVYIKLAQKALESQKDVIILVPEIILTPQIEKKFREVFGENLAVLHSRLTKKEKYNEWKKIVDKKVSICLGTRSAIFAPFENLGLIIIDEEHEATYKQTDTPRYDAKDVAKKRGVYNKAAVVYASATPSIDLYYYFATKKKNNMLLMTQRFHNKIPEIEILSLENKEDIINDKIINEITTTLAKKEQVLVLLNKRGYTNFIRCFECGHIYKCENCDISLNYHKKTNSLHCHFCGYKNSVNNISKCCEHPNLVSGMYGIQKVEEYLLEKIADASITRMDADTTSKKGAYEKLLNDFRNQKSNILLGTQMISKGLDFPNITLVVILSVDNLVAYPSFKSNEKLFNLLVQTAGRAGRSEKDSKVLIQSNIDSDVIKYALKNDYNKFYDYEINRRKLINYPPFCNISYLTIVGHDEQKTLLAAQMIFKFLKKYNVEQQILGPNKSLIYKINNEYRLNIAIKYSDADYKKLHKSLKYINNYFQEAYKKDKISLSIDNSAQDYV